jgi:hypothetical protein
MMFIRMVGAIHSKKLLKTSTDVGESGKSFPPPSLEEILSRKEGEGKLCQCLYKTLTKLEALMSRN